MFEIYVEQRWEIILLTVMLWILDKHELFYLPFLSILLNSTAMKYFSISNNYNASDELLISRLFTVQR